MKHEAPLLYLRGKRKYLNPTERMRFHECAHSMKDPHRQGFCLTLFYTGCRISEALALRASDIDLSERVIVFRTLKQRGEENFRAIPVPIELLEHLQGISTPEHPQLWPFGRTWAWGCVKACMRQAGLRGLHATPKGLRHGFAVACVDQSIPLTMLQRWMGHKSIETTKVYLNIVGKMEHDMAAKTWPKNRQIRKLGFINLPFSLVFKAK